MGVGEKRRRTPESPLGGTGRGIHSPVEAIGGRIVGAVTALFIEPPPESVGAHIDRGMGVDRTGVAARGGPHPVALIHCKVIIGGIGADSVTDHRAVVIKFSRDGRVIRESSKSGVEKDAVDLLKQRLGESVTGKYLGQPAARIRMEGLFQMVIDDCIRYDKRDLYQVRRRVRQHLIPALRKLRAAGLRDGAYQQLHHETQARKSSQRHYQSRTGDHTAGVRPSAKEHPPKVGRIPPVTKVPEDNARGGFIEQEQYDALRHRLKRAVTPLVIGYHLGLRKSAILALEWSMVDLPGAELRLPPRLAKNKKAQVCPRYGDLLRHLRHLRSHSSELL